jgi:hypothetical protein
MCSICFAKLAVADTPNLIQLKRPERTSEGTVKALHKIVPAIRQRFGSKVRIIVCVDSSVAREPIMGLSGDNEVFYCFDLEAV